MQRAVTFAVLALAMACGDRVKNPVPPSGSAPPATNGPANESVYVAKASRDSVHRPWTQADVNFVSGMIHHHAQALVMANMAPAHGASASVRTLCARIINAQTDEITLMQTWLRDRKQPIPDAKATPMKMAGMDHDMLMPGMLTDEQLKQLDASRGADFDQMFLLFMIRHHQGAVKMVKDLFASQGAGQDEYIFKLATDINVDQTTEINRMAKMLATLGSTPGQNP
jgi:uncharacterized protein (DUF305 family)